MNLYEDYIALSRYARYRDDIGRRETWEETVDRYMLHVVGDKVGGDKRNALRNAIVNKEVLPSMRGLMTAGAALDRDNTAIFNCAYLPVDHPRAFDEAMYILMCGTGVGFSVERQYTSKLPEVPEEFHNSSSVITVADSKIGWASAFKELLANLYAGVVPQWDMSKVRKSGARLKVFGGRASGPEPLEKLFKTTVAIFKGSAGRKLSSLECHDILCHVGETVVVGGVRRSALISLSNLSDDRMRRAKSGQWWETDGQRALANNSICYTEKPTFDSFLREWVTLHESKSGERGIFNRVASKKQAARNGRRDTDHDFGTNPCSEIILRPYQFCNLSSVVVRSEDSVSDLLRKVELATILGTVQATFTNFRYLRPLWKKNTSEECLLGVSFTGMMDHPLLSDTGPATKAILNKLREKSVEVNKEWAATLGINQATAITCVKPEGTVSQLTNSASGLHPRYSEYYIRRVRNDPKDPLSSFMAQKGVPYDIDEKGTYVFAFPIKAPPTSVLRNDMTAIEQMEHWLLVQEEWCEHKPSITVYYREGEFLALGQYVWDNFDKISGVAFLPHTDHVYNLAPYEEITEDKYNELLEEFPKEIDWTELVEEGDNTTGAQTLACTADGCEVL